MAFSCAIGATVWLKTSCPEVKKGETLLDAPRENPGDEGISIVRWVSEQTFDWKEPCEKRNSGCDNSMLMVRFRHLYGQNNH